MNLTKFITTEITLDNHRDQLLVNRLNIKDEAERKGYVNGVLDLYNLITKDESKQEI